MGGGIDQRPDTSSDLTSRTSNASGAPGPGKRSLTEQVIAHPPVQRAPAHAATGPTAVPAVAAPEAGINKPGFIDNSRGAPIAGPPKVRAPIGRLTRLPGGRGERRRPKRAGRRGPSWPSTSLQPAKLSSNGSTA